jgi:magnesium-transporting ATPase (P-type)
MTSETQNGNLVPHIQEKRTGLTSAEALKLQGQFGRNALPAEKGVSSWTILLNQFKSPLVYIILFAAAVSLAVKEYGDFAIIMVVVVIDAVLGFIQANLLPFQVGRMDQLHAGVAQLNV